jgi:hypothetical protein
MKPPDSYRKNTPVFGVRGRGSWRQLGEAAVEEYCSCSRPLIAHQRHRGPDRHGRFLGWTCRPGDRGGDPNFVIGREFRSRSPIFRSPTDGPRYPEFQRASMGRRSAPSSSSRSKAYRTETAVIRQFQERMPLGCSCRTCSLDRRGADCYCRSITCCEDEPNPTKFRRIRSHAGHATGVWRSDHRMPHVGGIDAAVLHFGTLRPRRQRPVPASHRYA